MRSSHISRKLLSLLAITTLLASSVALADPEEDFQRRVREAEAQAQIDAQQQPSGGLTPGQVQNNTPSIDLARQQERQARDQILRDQERQARDQMQRDQERQARDQMLRDQFQRDEFRRQQDRQQQEQINAQNQAIFEQQQALAAEAARVEAERQALARQGSATAIFTDVTRKTGGEWLRVSLSTPQQLSKLNIVVLKAAAKIHQVVVHAANGQVFNLSDINPNMVFSADMNAVGDLRGISNRVVAIDIRAEAMGGLAIISVNINSLEGSPALTKVRFPNK